MRGHIGVLMGLMLVASVPMGCRPWGSTVDPSASGTKNRAVTAKATLMPHLYDDPIQVCVKGTYDGGDALAESVVEHSFNRWFDVFRKFDPTVPGRIRQSCGQRNALTIEFLPGRGRAQYYSDQARIVLYSGDGGDTLMHELGHAFGLADTYLENAAPGRQLGQPSSLMSCDYWLGITNDDIAGMASLFANFHGERVNYDNWNSPEAARKDPHFRLWKVMARVGGDIDDPCFFFQQTEVFRALEDLSAADPSALTRVASRRGYGDRRTVVYLQSSNNAVWGKPIDVVDRSEYVNVVFSSSAKRGADADFRLREVYTSRDKYGGEVKCTVVKSSALQPILNFNGLRN